MPPSQPYDENELLSRIAQDDEQAMQAIFKVYYPRLCFFAESLTGNREESKDMAQEALMQLWHSRKRFSHQHKANLEAFLFTIVRRDCYDYHKHQRVKRNKQEAITATTNITEEGVDALIVHMEVLQKIYQEIDHLPPHLAEIVKLSFVEGLSTQDIAGRLQMTPNHVRVQKSRALEKLRTALLKQHMLAPSCLILFLL